MQTLAIDAIRLFKMATNQKYFFPITFSCFEWFRFKNIQDTHKMIVHWFCLPNTHSNQIVCDVSCWAMAAMTVLVDLHLFVRLVFKRGCRLVFQINDQLMILKQNVFSLIKNLGRHTRKLCIWTAKRHTLVVAIHEQISYQVSQRATATRMVPILAQMFTNLIVWKWTFIPLTMSAIFERWTRNLKNLVYEVLTSLPTTGKRWTWFCCPHFSTLQRTRHWIGVCKVFWMKTDRFTTSGQCFFSECR